MQDDVRLLPIAAAAADQPDVNQQGSPLAGISAAGANGNANDEGPCDLRVTGPNGRRGHGAPARDDARLLPVSIASHPATPWAAGTRVRARYEAPKYGTTAKNWYPGRVFGNSWCSPEDGVLRR